MLYYTFTIDGRPVGYYVIDEGQDEIYMNAKMCIEGVTQENRFRVRLSHGKPTHVRLGDGEWKPVPEGTLPTSAYTVILRSGTRRYEAFVEGIGRTESRNILAEGNVFVEYVRGRAGRRFQMQCGAINYICWGGTAESRLVSTKAEAVRGTVFELSCNAVDN